MHGGIVTDGTLRDHSSQVLEEGTFRRGRPSIGEGNVLGGSQVEPISGAISSVGAYDNRSLSCD
jgi:hypothetical protein